MLWPHPSGAMDLDALIAVYGYPDGSAAPCLRANMVSSLDGAATSHGTARGLSSRADVQLLGLLRGLADVVIVGAQTVRAEGYGPTRARSDLAAIRRAEGRPAAPTMAIVSRSLDLDADAPVFTEAVIRPVVLTARRAPRDRRAALQRVAQVVDCGEDVVDVAAALDHLAAEGCPRQLTEGGPTLLAQVVAAGRLDELALTTSPAIVGPGPQRILDSGSELATPTAMALSSLLMEDEHIFARYVGGRRA